MTSRRATLWLCMLALVVAQALGFMHRVLHAPVEPAVAQDVHADSGVHALFAGHDDGSTCRLLDAAGHEGPPVQAAPAAVLMPSHAMIVFTECEAIARRSELFQARGPPTSFT